MRFLLPTLVVLLLAGAPLRADDDDKPRGPKEQQIKVIDLGRKTPVLYEKDVEPILINKCAYCHSGNVKEGKLDLGTYETMVKGGKRGNPIVPGKPEQSMLVIFCGKEKRPFMPPKNDTALTPEELATIKLWVAQGAKAPSGARTLPKVVLRTPPASVSPVNGVAISPDNSTVAASRGNNIHIYDAKSGAHVRTLTDPGLKTPDGKPLSAAHLSLVESLVYSPDGKTLVSGAYQEVILWDAKTGALRQRITGFADRVVTLAFSSDGKLLATGGGAPTVEGELRIYDASNGKLLHDIKTNGHSDTVFGVAFSPDNKLLASCGADKFVKVYEASTGKFLKSFEGHTHHVMGVGWKADGKLLASCGADNLIKLWDYEKGEQARTIKGHDKQVTALLFVGKTPQFVTCSGDQTVRMWNADNGGNVRNFSAGNDYLYCVSVSPDGALVATGGQDGIVRLFNGTNGAIIKELAPPGVVKETPKK
jgi:WD40 repeat protein